MSLDSSARSRRATCVFFDVARPRHAAFISSLGICSCRTPLCRQNAHIPCSGLPPDLKPPCVPVPWPLLRSATWLKRRLLTPSNRNFWRVSLALLFASCSAAKWNVTHPGCFNTAQFDGRRSHVVPRKFPDRLHSSGTGRVDNASATGALFGSRGMHWSQRQRADPF